MAELGIGMIPIVGAGYDIYQAYKDPSLTNIGIAMGSTILDGICLLSGGTAALPIAAIKGGLKQGVKQGVKQAVKKAVVKSAVPKIERTLVRNAGSNRVTSSIHRQAVREAQQNAKKILISDLKSDATQQILFNVGQMGIQTKDGKFAWQSIENKERK